MGLYRGGRKPGSKNKRTDLFAKCDKIGVDVFEELLELAHGEPIPDKRFSKFFKLAEFLYAKPKDQGEVQLTADEIREWIKQNNGSGSEGTA